ncbi:hypothetical protein D3C72_2313760 [compost metagenome]
MDLPRPLQGQFLDCLYRGNRLDRVEPAGLIFMHGVGGQVVENQDGGHVTGFLEFGESTL